MSNAKTVLITGGYGGMGLDMARGFLAKGDNIVLNGRNADKLNDAVQKLNLPNRVLGVAGDVGDKHTGETIVAQAVEKFGSVDVLINNAGVFYAKPFLDNTEDDLDLFFHINLKGTYFTSQAAVKQMIDQGSGGAIINIGAVLVDHGMTGFPVSSAIASKGGIHALTTALSAELAPHNIRVNTVAPGVIRTPLHGDANVDDYAGIHPLNRVGEVAETTAAVLHIADATYTTGVIYPVDGGYRVGRQ